MRELQRRLTSLLPLPSNVPPRSEDEEREQDEEDEDDGPDGELGLAGSGGEEIGEADLKVGDEGGGAVRGDAETEEGKVVGGGAAEAGGG